MTAVATASAGSGWAQTQQLTARLVWLIEQDGVSVAQAARITGVPVDVAGVLVRLCAIEREAAETELEERIEDIERQCPGEDWWSYTDRQRASILGGEAIPNRIVRELVDPWRARTGLSTGHLAESIGITDEALRRSLGLAVTPARVKGGIRCPARVRKTVTVQTAGQILRALGVPPCEVPGL
jgi:hypothetical protein